MPAVPCYFLGALSSVNPLPSPTPSTDDREAVVTRAQAAYVEAITEMWSFSAPAIFNH